MNAPRSFVLRHGLPGLLGTAFVAIGALGVGWLPITSNMLANPLVNALRSSLTGSLAARAFVIIGLAILLQAWLVLGSELLADSRRGRFASIKDTLGILAMWAAPLLLAPPLFSRDLYSYYVQGRVYGAGYDPSTIGISVIPGWFDDGADPMWVESPTPYGPVFLMIERAVANFAHPNAYLGALLFRAVALVGVALIAYYVPRLSVAHGIDPARALWLGVLNPVLVMHFISGAHNDAIMVGLVVMGLALATEQRCLWGAVAVSLAVGIKPIAIVALPFVGLLWAGREGRWIDRIRSWAYALLVLACTLASVYLVAEAGAGVIKAAFGTPSGVLTWLSPTTAVGLLLGKLTTAVGLTADTSVMLAGVRLLGTVLGLLVILWLILRPGGRSPVRGAALALAVIVVLGPVVQPWYLLWFLPLFAATGLSARELRVAMILTALFTIHGMIESSANADNITDIGDNITFLMAIIVVVIIVAASPRERRLVLGTGESMGLEPASDDQAERSEAMRWPAGGRIHA
ncbi:MAG: polyprenol phosphomannose-dependent alpha 1,6 mannosyltransferase MptB [Actinomycetes bacterium]